MINFINIVKIKHPFFNTHVRTITAFIMLFGTAFSAYAQLSVRNDNFIIVNDEIIFVNDAITLGETDSKFYLRKEGQLIQGNEVSTNTGLGELSVYQTGNASNYTYNYWCSPVGNNSNLFGNESARVNLIDEATYLVTLQDPEGLTSSADVEFTSSFDGFSSPSLTISNRWLYTFNTSNDYTDWNYVGASSSILPGLGFTMKGVMGTTNQLYDFRGKANNGTISNIVTADEFTLIGNPYPSAIDALRFIHDPQNTNLNNAPSPQPTTTGALYFWEQSDEGSHMLSDYVGGYASYTISSTGVESFVNAMFSAYDGAGNPIPLAPSPDDNTGSKISKRYIPIGQGFMIEGASGILPGSLVHLKNAHRVYEKISDGNSMFFRSANTQTSSEDSDSSELLYNEYGLNNVPQDHKRFRLNVTFNDQYTRQLLHNFHHSATPEFDYGLEAKSSSDAPTDAYWILGTVPYTIQAHAYAIDLSLPVVVRSSQQQQLKFSIFDVQNFEDDQPIYLHDIENDIYIDLTQQDYDLNIEEGNFDARFRIVFQDDNTLNAQAHIKNQFDILAINQESQFLILNPNMKNLKSFQVYDINGRLVLSHSISSIEDQYNFPSKSLNDGVYLASIQLFNNESFTKKLIVNHK
ncbi:T9SS type A sorting domain-containing protein [Winogradskyella psychrotolerans]|uniref:T9SS type A sorting domain-containing protein n=1 Tax=Winogradskyella psychrotolerans TaxID=1344585 RepID=UPI001C07AD85|nr:T9SS type A sorting domain-containing protein [Winogradskyella psychrotolerans]MBU2920576.1 T9SS type A sorting domain-containing protein [Winogradskyella psychrotolerans]